jgi:hypothetical protein
LKKNVKAQGYIAKSYGHKAIYWYAEKYYFILPEKVFYPEFPMSLFTNGRYLGLGMESTNKKDGTKVMATEISPAKIPSENFTIPSNYKIMNQREFNIYKDSLQKK